MDGVEQRLSDLQLAVLTQRVAKCVYQDDPDCVAGIPWENATDEAKAVSAQVAFRAVQAFFIEDIGMIWNHERIGIPIWRVRALEGIEEAPQ